MVQENRHEHNKLQVEYFDKRADVFQQKIPDDIQERTAYIIKMADVNAESIILDVGTGTGVLIGHLLAAAVKQVNIVGCDLSQRMLSIARTHYQDVFFWNGDVMEFSFASPPEEMPGSIKKFDRIFFNACFANMLDRRGVLQHCKELLGAGGRVVVSHPAPEYVSWLHVSDPGIVPHLLPTKDEATEWASSLGFRVEHFESAQDLYLAIFALND